MSNLIHFKCNYDPSWDYASIARRFFGDGKCLVVAEKMVTNAHVHFQGYSAHSTALVDKFITEFAATHYSRKEYPNGRPVKRARRSVDEVGFQYLCKESHPPLFVQGFTEEELDELRQKSLDYVKQFGEGFQQVVNDISANGKSVCQMYAEAKMCCGDYCLEVDKWPRNFQRAVLLGLLKHPNCSREWKIYIYDRI